jgi:hypothetical protein
MTTKSSRASAEIAWFGSPRAIGIGGAVHNLNTIRDPKRLRSYDAICSSEHRGVRKFASLPKHTNRINFRHPLRQVFVIDRPDNPAYHYALSHLSLLILESISRR